MKKIWFLMVVITFAGFSLAGNPAQAAEKDKPARETPKDQVYKHTSEAIKAIDNHPRNRKIYGLKKLYENDDVTIFRGFDKDGRRYTFTKRK